jgi:ABC-type spermidine/putrescine transport system permease subunit II
LETRYHQAYLITEFKRLRATATSTEIAVTAALAAAIVISIRGAGFKERRKLRRRRIVSRCTDVTFFAVGDIVCASAVATLFLPVAAVAFNVDC